MTSQDFLVLLRGGVVGPGPGMPALPALADAPVPALPALADADDDPRLDAMPLVGPLPEGVVEAPVGAELAPVVPALPPLDDLVGPALPAFAPVVVLGYTIKYPDSHSSGIGRWYIQCKYHNRCFKYRQVNLHPDNRHLFAFLLAWAELGDSMPRELHTDPLLAPSDRDLEAALVHVP